ncbi:hypothetical protein JAAARDRAFT_35993 [Jaapia argillacea MUCL 33604]|uniref:BHLH domain-containing protein n=1 Tax=Jaapia argillacea MUCL 33604 TaxID=933084 RepID=A0A067Q1H9_9AGAM|nr:hypothetical protein JAAARDRAFT_35993 [Jaapia argillacea MUCL 33604]
MPLLSPTESHAFQSFLSSIDYGDYSGSSLPAEWVGYAQEIVGDLPVAGEGKLAKATKDLMALDGDRDRDRSDAWSSGSSSASSYTPSLNGDQSRTRIQDSPVFSNGIPPSSSSSSNLASSSSQLNLTQTLFSSYPNPNVHQPPINSYSSILNHIAPSHTQFRVQPPSSSQSTPTPPPSNGIPHPKPKRGSTDDTMLASNKRRRSSPAPTTLLSRSSTVPSSHHHHISQSAPAPSRSSTSSSQRSGSVSGSSTSTTSTLRPPPSKPPLLTASQKKANHIQSEQKRRANIRRGYEALCDTVPALREAIKKEEEEARLAKKNGEKVESDKGAKKGKRRGKKGANGNGNVEDGERADGRAGPRSENVVLQKTIDYIQDLLSDRTVLLTRLQRARSMLFPAHPALMPSQTRLGPDGKPLWEREWGGGTGDVDIGDGEGEGEEGEQEGGESDEDL